MRNKLGLQISKCRKNNFTFLLEILKEKLSFWKIQIANRTSKGFAQSRMKLTNISEKKHLIRTLKKYFVENLILNVVIKWTNETVSNNRH